MYLKKRMQNNKRQKISTSFALFSDLKQFESQQLNSCLVIIVDNGLYREKDIERERQRLRLV